MPFRTFLIPLADDGAQAEEMNAFLRRVKLVAVEKHLVAARDAWAFCIEYLDGPANGVSAGRPSTKVDYRAVLSAEDFACYASLRDLRKGLAEGAGVPVYAVFTNEQLAAIARQRPECLTTLRAIDGVGEARAQAHGQAVLDHLRQRASASSPSGRASCAAP